MIKEGNLGGLEVYDLRDRFPEVNGQFPRRAETAIVRLVVHHTVTRSPKGLADALTLLDEIQRYHTTQVNPAIGLPFPAIGYHICLDTEGRVYWVNGLNLVTYHAKAANPDSIGLAILGTFTTVAPSASVQAQVRQVHAALERHLGRKLGLVGHKDVDPTTACPGSWWAGFRAGAPPPVSGEVPPEPWRQWGQSWIEVAQALKARGDEAIAAGARSVELARQIEEQWTSH